MRTDETDKQGCSQSSSKDYTRLLLDNMCTSFMVLVNISAIVYATWGGQKAALFILMSRFF